MSEPYLQRDGQTYVYGYSLDSAWWSGLNPAEAESICLGERGPEAKLASMVAAAYEELTVLRQHGLTIAGIRWADIGGDRGQYSVALKALGANAVSLVEPRPVDDVAQRVLDASGVEVFEATAQQFSSPRIEATLRLYVPPVAFPELQCSTPNATILLLDEVFDTGTSATRCHGPSRADRRTRVSSCWVRAAPLHVTVSFGHQRRARCWHQEPHRSQKWNGIVLPPCSTSTILLTSPRIRTREILTRASLRWMTSHFEAH